MNTFQLLKTEWTLFEKQISGNIWWICYWISVLQYEKVSEILSDRHVMPEWSGWNKAMKAMNGTLDFVKTAIDQHKSNYNEDVKENPKDFIDAFLNQINDKDNIG